MQLILVFLGGGVGSVCRYAIGKALPPVGNGFPVGTLVVNLAGCVLVGLLFRFAPDMQGDTALRAALIVGFCGGFTTFSAFGLETASLLMTGRAGVAALYVTTSVVGCLLGTVAALGLKR
jgi:fluoride exporter